MDYHLANRHQESVRTVFRATGLVADIERARKAVARLEGKIVLVRDKSANNRLLLGEIVRYEHNKHLYGLREIVSKNITSLNFQNLSEIYI